MPTVEIDGTNSTVKTNVLTSQSGTAITVPTGKVLTVTDAAGLTVAGTAVTPASYLSAIPDNSVTGAKLNISLLAGDTMYASGTDTLAKLAKGTAAQVLTMNTGATAPEWADAGGSHWTLIDSGTITNGTNLIITNITGAFRVIMQDADGTGTGSAIRVVTSTNNGSSYNTGGSDYSNSGFSKYNGNTLNVYTDTTSAYITAGVSGGMMVLDCVQPANSTNYTHIATQYSGSYAADGFQLIFNHGQRNAAEVNNAIKIYHTSSGNWNCKYAIIKL